MPDRAPFPHGSVRLQSKAKRLAAARGNGDDAGKPRNLDGKSPIGGCSVAQLAITVVAPCPYRAVMFRSDAVKDPDRQGNHVGYLSLDRRAGEALRTSVA